MDVALHASVESTQVQLPKDGSVNADDLWSRSLAPICFKADPSEADDRGFGVAFNNGRSCHDRLDLDWDDSEAQQTVTNSSGLNRVVAVGQKQGVLAIIADQNAQTSSSYVASTFGVRTSCHVSRADCDINIAESTYTCPELQLEGQFSQPLNWSYLDTNYPLSYADPEMPNPLSWSVAAVVNGDAETHEALVSTSDAAVVNNGNKLFIVVDCSSSVHNVDYSYVQGDFKIMMDSLANASTTSLVLAPVFPRLVEGSAGWGKKVLLSGLTAAVATEPSAQMVADSFAGVVNRVALSATTGIVSPSPVKYQLVATAYTLVPKAAAIIVVCLSHIYVIIGIALTGSAVYFCQKDPDVMDVQSRLSIMGLTAQAFEPRASGHPATRMRDLFKYSDIHEERIVRVKRTERGGWSWEAL
ncbi:hypothetical protein BDY21DRAFT_341584 [Lineolata rhizophorae]|uniref:Uncharacterized protein n=1 Tax=Lineolata rhizophorae TaxID=578093 RepID=A0A6A6P2C8_9PEZI|nr:hypothetical protein BDY21DRAFT_341584 [Lineolata rhizophorae]